MLLSRVIKRTKHRCTAIQFNYDPPFGFRKGCVLWFGPPNFKDLKKGDIIALTCIGNTGYALVKITKDGPNYEWEQGDGTYNFEHRQWKVEGTFLREECGSAAEALIREADKSEADDETPNQLFFTKTPTVEKDPELGS